MESPCHDHQPGQLTILPRSPRLNTQIPQPQRILKRGDSSGNKSSPAPIKEIGMGSVRNHRPVFKKIWVLQKELFPKKVLIQIEMGPQGGFQISRKPRVTDTCLRLLNLIWFSRPKKRAHVKNDLLGRMLQNILGKGLLSH